MTEEKKPSIQITPDTAIGFVDGVLEKFEGTRTDHKVLEASMSLLKTIVVEWKELKSQSQALTPAPTAEPATEKSGKLKAINGGTPQNGKPKKRRGPVSSPAKV